MKKTVTNEINEINNINKISETNDQQSQIKQNSMEQNFIKNISFHIDPKTGWVQNIAHLKSPNCNNRPQETEIDLLVIHNISLPPGEFGGPHIDAFFTNTLDPKIHPYFLEIAHLKVSSHCFINREGHLKQFVSFHDRAWHAGESEFEGKTNCNDYSIGIELEGTDTSPYTQAQYETLAALTRSLLSTYPKITWDRIVGHSTIAPARKTDPGPAFDWNFFAKLMKTKGI